VNCGFSLPPLSWEDWLSVAALSVAIVALALWIADRAWSLWRLRRRPVEARCTPQQIKVRIGEPVAFFVKVENRSPRVLQIRLGAAVTQPIPAEAWPEQSALERDSARRMSDGRTFQPVDYIELQGFDLQYFRYELISIRAGKGSVRPYLEITGLPVKGSVIRFGEFEFEVVGMNVYAARTFSAAGPD